MLKIAKISLTILLTAGGLFSAGAVTISITPATNPQWTGNNNANMNENQIANAIGFAPGALTEVYKQNVDEANDSGDFSTSYQTTFQNSPSDPQDCLIDYISGPSITGGSIYLYVKDGNSSPAWYVFDITGWNGTDDLALTGFWPDNGAISHVALLRGQSPSVPDAGATIALLGLGLGSIGLLRRKLGA